MDVIVGILISAYFPMVFAGVAYTEYIVRLAKRGVLADVPMFPLAPVFFGIAWFIGLAAIVGLSWWVLGFYVAGLAIDVVWAVLWSWKIFPALLCLLHGGRAVQLQD